MVTVTRSPTASRPEMVMNGFPPGYRSVCASTCQTVAGDAGMSMACATVLIGTGP